MIMIIDGTNAVLGRVASHTAKKLLAGEEVRIINAEKMLISGSPKGIKEKYLQRRRRGSPHHGPFFPKRPDLIVRRAIRSMLPYKTGRGRIAYKKLRVMIGNPDNEKGESIEVKRIKANYITISRLAKTIGWNE